MLTVFVKQGVLGDGPVLGEQFPFVEGETPRTLANRVAEHLPKSVPIDVAMHGRLLSEDEYDIPLRDGDEVVFCGHVAAGLDLVALLVQAVIAAALSVAVNYALQSLNPQPTVPDVPQDRGDESSPTYSWLGIQTNYGQGYTVPAVYGRHGVGGQVISTDVVASVSLQGQLQDRLNILLALSEGPIDKIGDLEIAENGNDFLGSTTAYPSSLTNGSLPNYIRVNDVMLVNDGNPVFGYHIPANQGTTAIWFNNTTPDVRPGDTLYCWDVINGVQVAGTARVVSFNVIGTAPPNNAVVSDFVIDSIPPAWDAAANAPSQTLLRVSRQLGSPSEFTTLASGTLAGVPHYSLIEIVPDVAGVLGFFRKGTLDQPPMPSSNGTGPSGPWVGASVTFSPGNQLNEFGDTAVYAYNTGDDPVQRIVFTLSAPVGIYEQDQQGGLSPFPVFFTFQWRYEGETTWRDFNNTEGGFVGTSVRSGPWLWTFSRGFDEPVDGNIEVKVQRTTANGGVGTVSSIVWRDVTFATGYQLSYPRVACMGLSLEANARWNGGLPNVNVRVDGIKVRMWDSVEGWSDPTWEVPAAPFDWHTHPPGRNPAWILLDFLLAPWGLGAYLTEDDIDLQAFANWAVYCDEDPSTTEPWGEPRYTCDLVIDRARPAWEWVLAICATGRASPVFVDGKISVVYEFRDAHAQGNVSVAAKSVTQLFTTGNLSDMTVTWLPRANRPTAFVYQFLNEDFEWRQDVLPFEDEEATFNDSSELFPDEYRPQQVQAFGQTRPTQLYRDSVYRHRVGRLITRKIDFKTGRWALASHIGDLIDIETELMRPFPDAVSPMTPDVPASCAIWEDVVTSMNVMIDHGGIPATGAIKVRQPDGTPFVTTFTKDSEFTVNGRTVTLITTAANVTADKGAPCVLGTVDKLTETYQIVAVTMNEDLTHAVTALQWVPEVHDEVPASAYKDGTSVDTIAEPPATPVESEVFDSEVTIVAKPGGTHAVQFAKLPQRMSVATRVYVRGGDGEIWDLVGVTEGGDIDIGKRRAHSVIQVALAPESFDGEAPVVPRVITTVKVPEFTPVVPPSVSNPVWHETQGTLMLTWDEITTVGVAFYEIREGKSWNGGRVLARTTDTRFVFPVPPSTSSLMIAVQMRDGSQSNPTFTPPVLLWEPWDTYKAVARDDLSAYSGDATLVDAEINASGGYIELSAGKFGGSYTTDTIDAGYVAPFLWRVHTEAHELDAATVDDWDFRLGDGEAAWWTVDGRGASPGLPGVDWQRTVDDLALLTVDSLQDEMVHGPRGEAGSHTRVLLESRFSSDGETWTNWSEHVDGIRVCRFAEFRVTMERETLMHEAQVHQLVITAHI